MNDRFNAARAVCCVFCAILLAPCSVSAQYVGPSSQPVYRSVADVLKNPVDDAPVALDGYLVRHLRKDKYVFSDGETEIRVEIDRKIFPLKPVSEKTRIQIRGEVEKEFMQSPEIDVGHIAVFD